MQINNERVKDATQYSIDTIKHVCKTFGPREPGSKAEKSAQDYIANDIITNDWADSVEFQPFQVAPKAFMGFSKMIPILFAIGLIAFWWLPWAPMVCCVIGLTILVLQFLFYWRFLDPLYKKFTSHNLIATKKPTGEVKKRIIVSGHSDSAYEWTVFNKFGAFVHIGSMVIAFIGALVAIVLSIVSVVLTVNNSMTDLYKIIFLVVMCLFTPGLLSLFLYSNYNRVVEGANDNLTGCMAAVSVLKYMKEEGLTFENTEVVCVLTGSEEAGLRGSKALVEGRKDILFQDGVETVFLGLETFHDTEHISACVRDLSGTVKLDTGMVNILDKAAKPYLDKPLPHISVYVGASDAAAFAQAKIPATTLSAMDPAPPRYYHTRHDTCENLVPECMEKGLKITLEAVNIYNEEGLIK